MSSSSSSSPSSRRIVFSCSRRNISRCRSPEFLLDLRLDLFLGVEHRDLALDVNQDPAQPLLDGERLEQDLPLGGADVEVPGDEVGQATRLIHAGQDLVDDLLGQAGLLPQLGRPGPRLLVQRDEGRILRAEGLHLLGLADDGLEVALLVAVVHRDAAPLTVEQQLHAGQAALHLADPGDGADGVEAVGGDLLEILPLRDGEDQPVRCGQRRLDRAQRPGPPGTDRRRDAREENDLPERAAPAASNVQSLVTPCIRQSGRIYLQVRRNAPEVQ